MWNFLLNHTPIFYFTQSLWRDEAFSVLLAQRPLLSFIGDITFEPPLYYILLHFWMKLFGTGETAIRSLSLLGFSLTVFVVIRWADKTFHKHWLSWFLPLFFFLNPELLYYAFEVRAYGWYMFFSVVSMYAYLERKAAIYIAATTLGLYTHTYMIFVPLVQVVHYLYIQRNVLFSKKRFSLLTDRMTRSFVLIGLLYAPWLIKVITELSKLKESWYFPVDARLIKSVLGNIFIGYEGTPWYLWPFTVVISMIILLASWHAIAVPRRRLRNAFFFLLLFVPLGMVIGVSFYKPLFVNRYVMPSTIAEIFLIVFAIENIRNIYIQRLTAAAALAFVVGFNLWYPGKYAKVDIRSAIFQINALAKPNDVILADGPLILFESIYYSKNSNVFWYNPQGSLFPWYVGDIIVSPDQIVRELPPYPTRAFIVHANGSYEESYNTPVENKYEN